MLPNSFASLQPYRTVNENAPRNATNNRALGTFILTPLSVWGNVVPHDETLGVIAVRHTHRSDNLADTGAYLGCTNNGTHAGTNIYCTIENGLPFTGVCRATTEDHRMTENHGCRQEPDGSNEGGGVPQR